MRKIVEFFKSLIVKKSDVEFQLSKAWVEL